MASKAYLFIIGTLLIFLHRDKAFAVPHKHPNLVPTKAFHKHNSSTSSREFYSTQFLRSTPSEYLRPYTKGSIHTVLETQGRPSVQPFPTFVASSIVLLGTASTSALDGLSPRSADPIPSSTIDRLMLKDSISKRMTHTDVFLPVDIGPLPSQILARGDHPAPRLGIVPQDNPIPTNKFYANLFLGSQSQGVWTHPYSLAWSKGSGNAKSWGMAISHIDANQRAYGPPDHTIHGHPVKYFINPIGIQSIILSATELGPSSILTSNNLQSFSAMANLHPYGGSPASLTFPLVQGMGFITGIYANLQPVIESSVFFRALVPAGCPRIGIFKYRIILEDNKNWLLYARPNDGHDPHLSLISNTRLQGPANWSGIVQIAKNTEGNAGEFIYDGSAGVYATNATIVGSKSGTLGTYQLRWTKCGIATGNSSPRLLMFALPHHVQSFNGPTALNIKSIRLQTTTKGMATAVVADSWTLLEPDLPTDIGFAPWTPLHRNATRISTAANHVIKAIAQEEIRQDMGAQTNLDSMYFSGKALSKFATLVYAVHDLAQQPKLAMEGLAQLKAAIACFVKNKQKYPLVYDTAWKGVVSSGSYITGDAGQDFGNTFYNDHHFHYAYFIHAAAVIAYLDHEWLEQNKDWVNMLVRDASNPSIQDKYFPFSRSFDWYHGHSFAKGLYESADSKDQESSSEDSFFSYALKMWGHVIGDHSMEARGNLMLAIQARSMKNYFLMESDNKVQPSSFIANKVAGILFENKIDHTTYFGANIEYIQGIHMIPLNPSSAYTRCARFVHEEWTSYFATIGTHPAQSVLGGWRGILYGNLATVDPKAAWDFFAQKNFDMGWLDGGSSRTWYLAFAAALGGA